MRDPSRSRVRYPISAGHRERGSKYTMPHMCILPLIHIASDLHVLDLARNTELRGAGSHSFDHRRPSICFQIRRSTLWTTLLLDAHSRGVSTLCLDDELAVQITQ